MEKNGQSRLPEEIFNALRNGKFSLVIKGEAGSGKTTLALEIIRSMPKRSSFYISSRIAPDLLYKQFPWIKESIGTENIIDARTTRIPEKEKDYEKITARNASLFIKQLYEKVSTAPGTPVSVIIDSIDAIKSSMQIDWTNLDLERALIDLMYSINGNIIFVVERFDIIKLDFLVDGVITLKRNLVNGRLIRRMNIEKVRGQRIVNPSLVFTLHEGMFRYTFCIPKQESFLVENHSMELVSNIESSMNYLSTQIEHFDNFLGGGIQFGSFNVIEVGCDVGDSYNWVLLPITISAIKNNYFIYLIPPAGLPAKKILNFYTSFLDEESIEKNTEIFGINFPRMKNFTTKNTFLMNNQSIEIAFEETEKVIENALRRQNYNGVIGIVGVDTLEYTYGIDQILNILGRWVTNTKAHKRIVFLIVKHKQKILNDIVQLADTHFVIDFINNTLLFHGKIPWTGYYALTTEIKDNKLSVKMIPIE